MMFGRYRLDEQLSHGAAATVYRAVDTSQGDRIVALKVFSPLLSADPGFRARFRSDAAMLSELREPHVVPIHSYGEIDGHAYLDMRLVRGPSLAAALRTGPLDPARAHLVEQQVRVAIESLHRGGLGHRPLDRGDVLLTGSPEREFVQLVGLGLGRPPVPPEAVPAPAALLTPVPGWTPPRTRRRWTIAAVGAAVVTVVAAVAATVAVLVTTTSGGPAPLAMPVPPAGPPGLVATMPDPAARITGAEVAELDGRPVVVVSTADGTIQTWDVGTGETVRPPIPGSVKALVTTVIDGRPAVVASTGDGTLVLHDLASGALLAPPAGEPGTFTDGLTPTQIDGVPAVVASGQPTGVTRTRSPEEIEVLEAWEGPNGDYTTEPQVGVRLFTLPDAAPAGPLLAEEGLQVFNFEVMTIADRPVLVSIDATGRVHARDLGTGAPVGTPTAPHPAFGLATTVLNGTPVAVTGGDDNLVRVWNLLTGAQIGPSLVGHTATVVGLHTVQVGGRVLLVSSAALLRSLEDTETRFWDLAAGVPVGQPLTAHHTAFTWSDGVLDGRPVLIAREPRIEGTLTVWDAAIVSGMGHS
jgi:WD40 repeat protein